MQVLITGGTGSFGNRMVRHLLDLGCDRINVLSRDEAKQDAMRHQVADDRVRYYVGDVRDLDSVSAAARDCSHVFHAAALKQVPSCEFFPMQAVATNVIGTSNVIRAAEAAGVQNVVCLSTDKAVYPINAMGLSKAMMEKVAGAHGLQNPASETVVSCVRYGNVLYSRGSVVPLFIEQLKKGDQLTITDPAMTRFVMTLDESIGLVETAFHNAQQGEVYVRKVPSCTILDLASAVAEIFDRDPDIRVIGTRHGEKKSEQLATREELARSTDCGDYFRISPDTRALDYSLYVSEGDERIASIADYDSHSARRISRAELLDMLRALPEVVRELENWSP